MYTIRQSQYRSNFLSSHAFPDYDLWLYGLRPKTRRPVFLSALLFKMKNVYKFYGVYIDTAFVLFTQEKQADASEFP